MRERIGCPGFALEANGPGGQGLGVGDLAVLLEDFCITTCANDKQTLILRKCFLSTPLSLRAPAVQ
ncbi:MAG: hypothetical protein C0460_09910 [Methylibium sp.]|nr:hypothetical protein [Methylibium sp.]